MGYLGHTVKCAWNLVRLCEAGFPQPSHVCHGRGSYYAKHEIGCQSDEHVREMKGFAIAEAH